MRIHGLEALQGETAFAFLVLRLRRAGDRDELVHVIRQIATMIPDAEAFIAELPDDLGDAMRVVGMPWQPAIDEQGVEEQEALVARVGAIEAAWFFQTGTAMPTVGDGDQDDDDDDDDSDPDAEWEDTEVTGTKGILVQDLAEGAGTEAVDASWSHGPPPMATAAPFPVDGYPAIIDELDWQDFGIAFKLAGDWLPGESTVLLGFHALWLAPYGGRYRNAAVTVDTRHHSAHLWVDRFAVPCSPADQVHHLMWVLGKIHEVMPILHARFSGATMAQKYGGLMGETAEPFVLGGNPLIAVHAQGGERGVDAWIETQTGWSNEEIAQMLRELAIELVTGSDVVDDEAPVAPRRRTRAETTVFTGRSDVPAELAVADDEQADDDDADDDRGRQITRFAGELLSARAAQGVLDPQVADRIRPVLDIPEKYEHRRAAVVEILGVLRDRASVPQMIRILEDTPIRSSLESIGTEDFLVKVATALGAIADPAAIPALANVVRAAGDYNDEPRPAAAEALSACLAATPEPRDVDDSVLSALLAPIAERNDAEANADLHLAYVRLASVLTPSRREAARRRLEEVASRRSDPTPTLARKAALLLARTDSPEPAALADLSPHVHQALTTIDYAHEYTVRNIRIALRIGEALPGVVAADDLLWLTRFAEPDVRSRAHALLERIGRAAPPAPVFDRASARAVEDATMIELLVEPHLVGRAVLIAEVGRRKLAAARAAVIHAADTAITRARQGGANLLDPDTAILGAAVHTLRAFPLDIETIGLFDRMLRHSNHHVKWELLQDPPKDERLIGGMFHVLGEKWGWQETTAKAWLAELHDTPAFEAELRRQDMN
ncbi:hypothetical protein BH11MYX3_BH11MYX3_14110 [soil metagenome]